MDTKKEILKKVITFSVITCFISTGIFIWMFAGARDSFPAVLSMMYTPGISAILTALIFKEKISRFGWRLGRPKYLVYSFLAPMIVSIIGYGIIWMTGFADFSTEAVKNYKWAAMIGFDLPVPFLIGFFSKMIIASSLTMLATFGEELGWSGYLTPKLRNIFSITSTSLIVGIFWAVWHFPAIIGGFYGGGTPLWVALPGFTLVLIGASFFRTFLVDKSKSLWVGVILHASHNVILMGMFMEMTADKGYARYLVSETGVFLGIVYITVALLFGKLCLHNNIAQ